MICKDLDPLFSPRAVAVVGASQDLNSVGGQPVAHLKNHVYQGRIYPVNLAIPPRSTKRTSGTALVNTYRRMYSPA